MTSEPHEWPLVTVNILSYNRRDLVRDTLQKTLHELDYPRDRLEIILIDNESSDGTKEMAQAEFPDVKLLVIAKNMGVPAWNKGFEAGCGDYFLVLDDDCFITGDALKKAVRGAKENHADLVSFKVQNGYEPQLIYNDALNTGLLEFWGCSVLISRRAIERLKGFDPNIKFLLHELEFTMRFFDQGFKHLFLPEVVSQHMKTAAPDPKAAHLTLFLNHRRNLGYIAAKLLQPRDARAVLLSMICKIFMVSVKNPRMFVSVLNLIEGFRVGARHRDSVRPGVSRTYRRNFIEFVSPLRFLGTGWRRHQFFRNRSKFYPRKKASLQL